MDQNKILREIENFGWTVIALDATDYLPSFAYSIGLWKNYQHPEIIVFGLPVGMMHTVINEAGEMIKTGKKLETQKVYDDFFENGHASFVAVDEHHLTDYFSYPIQLNEGKAFPALQLVWTDKNLKFPWQEGFEAEYKFKQALLDRNIDFKFFEEKDLAVCTDKQFIEGKPILKVVHDASGEWQFLTGDEISKEDVALVGLEQMILKDPTLNDLFDLDYGQEAERKSITDKWLRKISS